MKKANLMVSTIIVMALIAGTLIVVAAVSSDVFGGISTLFASQQPCKPLDDFREKIEIACQYNYSMNAIVSIPSVMYNYQILTLPRANNDSELTGYDPNINPGYPECHGGVCICMMTTDYKTPDPTQCNFCYPIARQAYEPAFCCKYGVCRFENIASIPNVNEKTVNVSEGKETVKIFKGLTFILQNKTDNITWLKNFCDNEIYDGPGGEFIVDYNNSNVSAGCCFRENKLVGTCVKGPVNDLKNFVSFSKGEWPLEGKTSLNITLKKDGGIDLKKTKFKLWWII